MTAMEPFDPINDGSHDDIEPVSVTTAPKLRLHGGTDIGSRLAGLVGRSQLRDRGVHSRLGSVHSAS